MPYNYIRDIYTEYPFYQRMAKKLNGKKSRGDKDGREVYRVECPSCHQNESYMFTSNTKDTFIFKCFRDKCRLDSLSLHRLIKEYGGDEMFDEWRQKSWMKYENDWLPIKNRTKNDV